MGRRDGELRRPGGVGLLFLVILLAITAFGLLAYKAYADGDMNAAMEALALGGIISLIALFQYGLFTSFFSGLDRYSLIIMNLLCVVGLIMLYRINPNYAFRQCLFYGVGMLCMVVAMVLVRSTSIWERLSWLFIIAGMLLLPLGLLFGRVIGGSRNWVEIGGFTLQPSEFVKVLLVFAMAACFQQSNRVRNLWPVLMFVAYSMVILVLQKDLGSALLYFGTFIVVFYTATSRWLLTLLGLGAAGVGAYGSYLMFDHVRTRVEIWRDPWATYGTKGYQIAQSLMAIASGGMVGMGLGLGTPKLIPAYHTDFIFAVICEEFGILVGVALVAFYLLLVVRGALIALRARTPFHAVLAIGCTSLLTLQSFIILGGVIKMIPLTGITLPFVSYGGSSMIVSMVLIGVLEGVAVVNRERTRE